MGWVRKWGCCIPPCPRQSWGDASGIVRLEIWGPAAKQHVEKFNRSRCSRGACPGDPCQCRSCWAQWQQTAAMPSNEQRGNYAAIGRARSIEPGWHWESEDGCGALFATHLPCAAHDCHSAWCDLWAGGHAIHHSAYESTRGWHRGQKRLWLKSLDPWILGGGDIWHRWGMDLCIHRHLTSVSLRTRGFPQLAASFRFFRWMKYDNFTTWWFTRIESRYLVVHPS